MSIEREVQISVSIISTQMIQPTDSEERRALHTILTPRKIESLMNLEKSMRGAINRLGLSGGSKGEEEM
jgi:hypothetical protein